MITALNIYKILENGDLALHATIQDSRRGAYLLWDWFEKKWLLPLPSGHSRLFLSLFDDEIGNQLWNLGKDERLPLHQRITFVHTFDAVMVKRENLTALIKAFEKTINDMEDPGHLPVQVKIFKELLKKKDFIGVCWQQTTANSYIWNEGWVHDDTTGKKRRFNIYKDVYAIDDETSFKKQYWMFDDYFKGVALEDLPGLPVSYHERRLKQLNDGICSCGNRIYPVHYEKESGETIQPSWFCEKCNRYMHVGYSIAEINEIIDNRHLVETYKKWHEEDKEFINRLKTKKFKKARLHCPACGSDKIEIDIINEKGKTHFYEVHCHDCFYKEIKWFNYGWDVKDMSKLYFKARKSRVVKLKEKIKVLKKENRKLKKKLKKK